MIRYMTGFDYLPDIAAFTNDGWTQDFGTPTLDESETCSIFSRQSLSLPFNVYWTTPTFRVDAAGEGPIYVSFWYYSSAAAFNGNIILAALNGASVDGSFRISASGEVYVINALSAELGRSDPGKMSVQTWHHIEIKWTQKDSISADDCIVKVDGNEILNLAATTDTNYYSNGFTGWQIRNGTSGTTQKYDDFIIYDSTGSDWTDFKGPRYISTLVPDGTGNISQWTRSGGAANYETVDDAEYNSDTSYVETSTVSNKDLYTFDNLHSSIVTVDAVQAVLVGKKSAGDNFRTIHPITRISSTDYTPSTYSLSLGDDYTIDKRIWYDSPATSTAWTPAEINGAEFGIKVEA